MPLIRDIGKDDALSLLDGRCGRPMSPKRPTGSSAPTISRPTSPAVARISAIADISWRLPRGGGVWPRRCACIAKRRRVRWDITAMQFNFVLASNAGAVRLWHRSGLCDIGTIPDAFDHPSQGMVDAYVMHKRLIRAELRWCNLAQPGLAHRNQTGSRSLIRIGNLLESHLHTNRNAVDS